MSIVAEPGSVAELTRTTLSPVPSEMEVFIQLLDELAPELTEPVFELRDLYPVLVGARSLMVHVEECPRRTPNGNFRRNCYAALLGADFPLGRVCSCTPELVKLVDLVPQEGIEDPRTSLNARRLPTLQALRGVIELLEQALAAPGGPIPIRAFSALSQALLENLAYPGTRTGRDLVALALERLDRLWGVYREPGSLLAAIALLRGSAPVGPKAAAWLNALVEDDLDPLPVSGASELVLLDPEGTSPLLLLLRVVSPTQFWLGRALVILPVEALSLLPARFVLDHTPAPAGLVLDAQLSALMEELYTSVSAPSALGELLPLARATLSASR